MDFVSAKVGTHQLLKITEVIPQNYYNILHLSVDCGQVFLYD